MTITDSILYVGGCVIAIILGGIAAISPRTYVRRIWRRFDRPIVSGRELQERESRESPTALTVNRIGGIVLVVFGLFSLWVWIASQFR